MKGSSQNWSGYFWPVFRILFGLELKNKIMRFQSLLFIFGLSLLALNTQATNEWVLQSQNLTLSKTLVDDALLTRGVNATSLDSKHRQALLEELFIRESLLAKQSSIVLKPEQLAV